MQVLVAHNFYQQPGGEDQCVAAEIALLRANGHDVTEYHLHNQSVASLGRIQLGARTVWSGPAFRDLRELFRKHRPQIAHFHNTFPLISPAAYYAARAEGVPVVQTVHNFRIMCPTGLLFRNGQICEDCLGRAIAWPGIIRKCYRDSRLATGAIAAMTATHRALGTWANAVDRYIALTDFGRRKLIAGGLPSAKVSVKPNFVYPDPGRGPGNSGGAIFVGRLAAEKGLETLLAAWRSIGNQLPLTIVGDGPLASTVSEAAAENQQICWLGSQSLETVYSLIGDAAVLILPSRCYENFPRVIAEAFAKGTPVIASKQGGMAEIVDDGRTGFLFRPGDPDDLAEKVRQFLASPGTMACMRDAARRTYDEKFTADTNLPALLTIYEQARANPARREPAT